MKITIGEDELKRIIADHVGKRVGQQLREQSVIFVYDPYSHELIKVHVYLDEGE